MTGFRRAISAGAVIVAPYLDDPPDFRQERLYVVLGGLDQDLAPVLAHVLSEEIEPLVDVRNDCFLLREFQPSFGHEGFYQGLHLLFQHFFRCTGDDEVIGISYQVDHVIDVSCPTSPAFPGEVLEQSLFQTVQCQVCQHR